MSSWDKKLDEIEEYLRDDIESGRIPDRTIPFCRLAVALAGARELKYLTAKLQRSLQEEGNHVSLGTLELLVLALFGDFLYGALKHSGVTTLVIRYAEKDIVYPKGQS